MARGQWALLCARQPIADVLASPETSAELRARLVRVEKVRAFAAELGLRVGDNYSAYAAWPGDRVVTTVVATEPGRLEPLATWFPIVGRVPYRGFFDGESAAREASRLRRQGLGVCEVPVRAYSTLGWFDDPILNTILFDAEYRFAGTLFHELAHERLFIAGDSSFNESFAVAVEREGVRRWLARNATPAMQKAYDRERGRREDFLALVLATRGDLEALYASSTDDAEKRREKARLFDALHAGHAALKASWGGYAGYDGWFAGDLNNARLALVATYNVYVPAFERLLAEQEGDMAKFHEAVQGLSRLPKKERDAELERVAAGQS